MQTVIPTKSGDQRKQLNPHITGWMASSGSQPMGSTRKEGNFGQRFMLLAPGAASGFSSHLPASELLAGKLGQPGLK